MSVLAHLIATDQLEADMNLAELLAALQVKLAHYAECRSELKVLIEQVQAKLGEIAGAL